MNDASEQESQQRAREQALQQRRDEIVRRITTFQRRRTWAISFFIFIVLIFSVFGLLRMDFIPDNTNITQNGEHLLDFDRERTSLAKFSIVFYGAIPLLFMWNYTARLKLLRNDLSDIDNQLDLIRIPDQSQEQKAQKLLQIQQFELKRYYDQTLRQSNSIFYVGVLTMILGFSVIAWSMYFVSHNFIPLQGNEGTIQKWTGESVIVAVLGAIGGILTNFIGAMYIKMFSEIVQAVTKSHASLVATSHLHLANVFAANIRTDTLREETLADLALALNQPPSGTAIDREASPEPIQPKKRGFGVSRIHRSSG